MYAKFSHPKRQQLGLLCAPLPVDAQGTLRQTLPLYVQGALHQTLPLDVQGGIQGGLEFYLPNGNDAAIHQNPDFRQNDVVARSTRRRELGMNNVD